MEHFYFYAGLSFLLIHEMDAIRCKEWRILPGLSSLDDKTGELLFILAHVPLYLWIFWSLSATHTSELFRYWSAIFMVIHLGLHLVLLRHRNNAFKDWLSWVLIIGAAGCAALYLWV